MLTKSHSRSETQKYHLLSMTHCELSSRSDRGKTEDHNFTLSVLPDHEAWGFSDQADAKYAYIVASYENGNTGPNSPGDVDRWDYYPGHDWEEKGLEKWQEANMTVECIEQNTFLDQ